MRITVAFRLPAVAVVVSLLITTVATQAGATNNIGPCDANLCACIVDPIVIPDNPCPDWMSTGNDDGGPYDLVTYTKCIGENGAGQVFCNAADTAAFEAYPSTLMDCAIVPADDGTGGSGSGSRGIVTSFTVSDGRNGTVLISYDAEADPTTPPPLCPLSPPFATSGMPSGPPTPMPTVPPPTPPTSGASRASTIIAQRGLGIIAVVTFAALPCMLLTVLISLFV